MKQMIFKNYKPQDIEKKCINFNKKYIKITNAILFDKNKIIQKYTFKNRI